MQIHWPHTVHGHSKASKAQRFLACQIHLPYPQKVMSRDRFLSITWNMHLSDPAEDAANDRKKGADEYDCLHRIRPLYDSLRVVCKAVYHPDKNLSVDERMVATKARISLKQ